MHEHPLSEVVVLEEHTPLFEQSLLFLHGLAWCAEDAGTTSSTVQKQIMYNDEMNELVVIVVS